MTDAILGLEAIGLIVFLQRYRPMEPLRVRLWQAILTFTATVSLVGAVAHGLVMPKSTYEAIWKPMLLCLGLLIAALVLATIYDLWGRASTRRAIPAMTALALGFFAVTFIPGVTFLIFILYEIAGMVFALGAYGFLAIRKRRSGAGIVALGIVLQIVAAAVQASGPFEIRLIWRFDHNGIFHLIGMAATFLMVFGVARGFKPPQHS